MKNVQQKTKNLAYVEHAVLALIIMLAPPKLSDVLVKVPQEERRLNEAVYIFSFVQFWEI